MNIIYVFKLHHRIFWLKGTLSGSPIFNTQKMPKHSEAKRALQGHIAKTKTIFLPSPTLLGAEEHRAKETVSIPFECSYTESSAPTTADVLKTYAPALPRFCSVK